MTTYMTDSHVPSATIAVNRAILGLALLGNIALVPIASHFGMPSPSGRLSSANLWVVAAFCVAAFLVGARALPWPDRIVAGLVVPVAVFALPTVLDLTTFLSPTTDQAAAAIDGYTGWWLRSLVARAFIANGPVRDVSNAVYDLLPLWLALAALLDVGGNAVSRAKHEGWSKTTSSEGLFIQEFVLAGCIGYFMFILTPIVGPDAFAGDAWMQSFPDGAGHAALVPRNGMPSLHTAWTLLSLLATRGHNWRIRVVFLIILILTLAATLGFGLHYLCDLAAACPLVLAVRCISGRHTPQRGRLGGLIIGGSLLLAWVISIRGDVHPWPWSIVLMTASVGVPLARGRGILGARQPAPST